MIASLSSITSFGRAIAFAIFTFLVTGYYANAAEKLIVFDENPYDSSPRGLYEYNFSTEQLTFLIDVPMLAGVRFEGMEWNPVDNQIYFGSNIRYLFSFDLDSGTLGIVGQVPSIGFIRGITFQPVTNQMFGFGFGPRMYTISTVDASASLIGVTAGLDAGLAFTPDGKLWGLNGLQQLIQLSPTVGNILSTGAASIGNRPLGELTSSSDGTLYGISWQHGGISVIDKSTGLQSVVKDFPIHENGFMGITFVQVIPEPSSILLVVFGGGTLVSCRTARLNRGGSAAK